MVLIWYFYTYILQLPSAELPLEDLLKMYEGAFAENFHWPQPKPDSEEDSSEEGKILFVWKLC